MPIVPSNPREISLDVPGADVGGVSPIGRALSGLGRQVTDTSVEMLEDFRRVEAADAVHREMTQAKLDSQAYYSQLVLKSPDGYVTDENGEQMKNVDGTPRTISQEYRDWANERYEKAQLSMPSKLAQDHYRIQAADYFTSEISLSVKDEQERKVKFFTRNMDDTAHKLASAQVSTPDLRRLYDGANDTSTAVFAQAGKLFDKVQARERAIKYDAEAAEAMFEGGYNQVLENIRSQRPGFDRQDAIEYWRGVLAGDETKDPYAKSRKSLGLVTASEMLDPDKKAAIDEKFLRLMDLAKKLDRSDLDARLADHLAATEQKKGHSADRAYLRGAYKELQKKGDISNVEYARIESKLTAADMVGKYMQNPGFALASEAAMAAITQKAAESSYRSAQKNKDGDPTAMDAGRQTSGALGAELSRTRESMISARRSDWADYLSEWSGSVRNANRQLNFGNPVSFEGKKGVVSQLLRESRAAYTAAYPNEPQYWRIVSKPQSEQLAEYLKDFSKPVQGKALGVQSLVRAYGGDFPVLVNQMIDDGYLPERWRDVALWKSTTATAENISALMGMDKAAEGFFKSVMGSSYSIAQFDEEMSNNADIKNYVAAEVSGMDDENAKANQVSRILDTIRTKALMDAAAYNGSMSPREAVDAAFKALQGRHVHPVQVESKGGGFLGLGRKGEVSTLNIPKVMNGKEIGDLQRDQIVGWMATNKTPEALKRLGIVAPKNADGTPSKFEKEFYEQVESTGRWTVSPDKKGFLLRWRDRLEAKDKPTVGNKGQSVFFIPVEKVIEESIQQGTAKAVQEETRKRKFMQQFSPGDPLSKKR
jgi:hypothetical protein